MYADGAEYARQVKHLTKGTHWAARQGTLSLIRDGIAYHAYHFADRLFLMAKPVLWDGIFWHLMDLTFSRQPGPSRHWWGVACPAPKRDTASLGGPDAEARAAGAFGFAERGVKKLCSVDLSAMPARWLPNDRPQDYLITEVIILLARNDDAGARRLARDVIEGRRKAMYSIGGQDGRSFFQRVVDQSGERAV